MLKWLLGKQSQITLKGISTAQKQSQVLEEEIKKLYEYSKLLCPVIERGIYSNKVNNEAFNLAITERIDKLRKLQEEITI